MISPFRLSPAKQDLLICTAILISLFLISAYYDFLERWIAWSNDYEDWELDEVLTALALSCVGLGWFAYRRWQEATIRLRQLTLINRELNSEIDAREHMQRTLSESDQRLRKAMQMAKLGFYTWDAIADRCSYCSDELAAMHGVSPKEYIAQASSLDGEFALTHPDDRARVRAGMEALRNGQVFEMEYRTITPDGTARHVREIAQPIFDREGHVVREIGICQDITDMKTAETLLARALDVIPALFALFDADDKLVVCNQKYRDLYETETTPIRPGIPFETIVRSAGNAVGVGGPRGNVELWVQKRLNRRNAPMRSFEYQRGDGEWVELSDHCLEDGSVFTVAVVTTERRRVEDELRQAQKMEAVGQLTGGVAHDFNNLLGVILGNAEILEEEIGKSHPEIQAILRSGQRGAELTQRLLAFSRRQPLQPTAVCPAQLVESMHQLLKRTLGETIKIGVDIPADLWKVDADEGQLENALLNLALNARDAMPDGGTLGISVSNAPMKKSEKSGLIEVTPGDYVSLTVSDTGAGMPADVLEHVIEPFFTTKDVGEGSGLGLSMVYGFTKQSGGDIYIESGLGEGTRVTLFLPRACEEIETPALSVSQARAS